LPVALISALRLNVGTDYSTYRYVYLEINGGLSFLDVIHHHHEIAFILLCFIAKYAFNSFAFLCFSVSFIFVFFGIKALDNFFKEHKTACLALFIFYVVLFNLSLNIMRQAMAITIILYSLKFLLSKKWLKFVMMIAIASFFHKSAFVCTLFAPLYLLVKNVKTEKKIFLLMTVGTIGLTIMALISHYFNIFEVSLNFKFLLYVMPILILILMIIYLLKRQKKEITNQDYFLINLTFLQIPAQIIGMFFWQIDRLIFYMSISQILLIPSLLARLDKKKFFVIVIILWYIFYYFVMTYIMNSHDVLPYNTFLGLMNI
jgi:hypothetical protein